MSPDLLLAIETSTRRGEVALALVEPSEPRAQASGPATAGVAILGTRRLADERPHTADLLPAVADLLRDHGRHASDIALFAYSSGPGSFTGLRVAATIGRMLQATVGCRVIAVSTLETIARNALDVPDAPPRIAPILNAGRGQVYGAVYQRVAASQSEPRAASGLSEGDAQASADNELVCICEPALHDPANWLPTIAPPFCIVGDGIRQHAAACEQSPGTVLDETHWPPRVEQVVTIAARLAAEGRFCRPEQITPLYLRPPACEEVYEQRRAEARARRGE